MLIRDGCSPVQSHTICHRGNKAWGGQAARKYEGRNPKMRLQTERTGGRTRFSHTLIPACTCDECHLVSNEGQGESSLAAGGLVRPPDSDKLDLTDFKGALISCLVSLCYVVHQLQRDEDCGQICSHGDYCVRK